MPDPTPLPVRLVDLGPHVWAYLDKAEEAYRLGMGLAAFAVVLALALGAALVVTTGLRRG